MKKCLGQDYLDEGSVWNAMQFIMWLIFKKKVIVLKVLNQKKMGFVIFVEANLKLGKMTAKMLLMKS